jgi:hypothetical protein
MLQFQRDDLLKKFKKVSFPMVLVSQDCLHHSDIIFNKESSDTQLQINQKINNVDFFFFETEEKKPKFQKEVPSENFTMGWRTQKNETTNTKPKDTKQQKTQQKPKTKNLETKSNDIKPDQPLNNEILSEQQKPKTEETLNDNSNRVAQPFNEQRTGPINQIPSQMGFNQNQMLNYMQQQNVIFQQLIQPNLMMQNDPYFDPNFDFKVLEKYNQKLQFPENLPLWYLFHPMIKSSFGPLTTLQVENMFISKQIFSNSLIRFIDIYERRDHDQFNFFPIKELANESLLNEIIPSKVLKYLYVDNVQNIIPNNPENTTNTVQNINNDITHVEQTNNQEEYWEETLQPLQNDNNNKSKKNSKKKKQRNINEDQLNSNKNANNYNPSISIYSINPAATNFVQNNDDGENWEEVKKAKKPEKRTGKVVGANTARNTNNPITNLTSNTNNNVNINLNPPVKKVPENKSQNIDGTKLVEALSSKKKLDPSIEIIETDYISQPNNKTQGGGKKGKKGTKTKFTDLNIEIGNIKLTLGIENIGGDTYKVESKKKK